MYCKNCGIPIVKNAKFCSGCGASVESDLKPSPILNLDKKRLENVLGIQLTNQIIGIYLLWVLIHFILLIANWGATDYGTDHFWPISRPDDLEYYDLSEFLFYVIVPIVVLIVIHLLSPAKEAVKDDDKYVLEYKGDPVYLNLGIALLILSILALLSINFQFINETRNSMLLVTAVIRILVAVLVIDKSMDLNRNTIIWGLFGFFLPSIALIALGKAKKLKHK